MAARREEWPRVESRDKKRRGPGGPRRVHFTLSERNELKGLFLQLIKHPIKKLCGLVKNSGVFGRD